MKPRSWNLRLDHGQWTANGYPVSGDQPMPVPALEFRATAMSGRAAQCASPRIGGITWSPLLVWDVLLDGAVAGQLQRDWGAGSGFLILEPAVDDTLIPRILAGAAAVLNA